ncbi:rab-GTPase-TBC domain-containing protein [Mucor mucedo]|uniref:rab-GTPase-TBC domain-containing protein n=1 Tax=Mucor mucedo TaxID=29922 RepID=UPI00221F38F5|nr:rab-GTPase-TBC domain-containing protein [Mucor mucedo]KAI7892461.1 rab-GTPase-TBC domain-containing protein [Mucor mucedo]
MESAYKERLRYFQLVLSTEDDCLNEQWTPVIDMKSFREACFHGIPDEPGLRSTAWKVLLGYLPPDKRMWESTLKDKRLTYYNWVKDLLEDPSEEPPSVDHPLNAERGSKWASYFHDNSILEQIDKDVRRTLPDFAFFQLHVPMNPLNPLSPSSLPPPPPPPATVKEHETDPLHAVDEISEPTVTNKPRRFSFGLMGRPRSSSAASKKSMKLTASTSSNLPTNSTTTRARSNSKSSVRSFSSGMLETDMISTPRNIVRKLSTAFTNNKPSTSTPFAPKFDYKKKVAEPICPYISSRRTIFRRIAHLNEERMGNREHHHVELKGQQAMDADTQVMDYHWEAIERILFIYAKLNPGVGYVQGMNEILAPIYYVFAAKAADDDPPSQAYAEADSFFVFTTLMSDGRDHFVRSLDSDASTGIHATLWRMSQRLAWFDRPLFRDLGKKDIKEQYYAFRWITVLCSQEWDLPDLIRLWDSILADRGMQEKEGGFEFLLDFAVAMLICIRQELIQGDFADNMRILQNYPIDDIQIVLNSAYAIRETRLEAVATGKIIPGVNDRRSSGMFDYSDTSSISSTGSGNRFRKLKDTSDMARASLDSLRRGSKESLDDLFKRGLSLTRNGLGESEVDRKRASTGDMMTRSLSQKLGFGAAANLKVKRTSSVRSQQSVIEDQIHRDWLLANQLSNGNDQPQQPQPQQHYHTRQNSISSNSFMNRFSQFVSSKPVSPVIKKNETDKNTHDTVIGRTAQQAYRGLV